MDGEWSFIETLRHLLLRPPTPGCGARCSATPAPFDPLDLPHDEMPDLDGVPNDPDARPSLGRGAGCCARTGWAVARRFFAELTDEQLAGDDHR